MSTPQSLPNFQQLTKQTTQFMPCSWQQYKPQHLGVFLPLHPHVPSVQCAKRVCWREDLIVKEKFTARSSAAVLKRDFP